MLETAAVGRHVPSVHTSLLNSTGGELRPFGTHRLASKSHLGATRMKINVVLLNTKYFFF